MSDILPRQAGSHTSCPLRDGVAPPPLFCTWPKVVCIMCLSAQWEAAGQQALALAPGHQCVPSLSLCHHIQFI